MRLVKGYPATTMDDYQLNTINLLKYANRNFQEREIVGRKNNGKIVRTNYEETYTFVSKIANALESLGVKPGDRIGVLDWNTYNYYSLFFAISGIGAMLVELNLRLHPSEISYVANHSKVKYIFVDESLINIAETISEKVKPKNFIVISEDNRLETKIENVIFFYDLIEKQKESYDFPMVDERTACIATYSSGTTGSPKGVYYSHRAIVLHALSQAVALNLKPDDNILFLVPMFHIHSWNMPYSSTLAGAKLVFPGRYSINEPKEIIDLIINEKITLFNAAPTVLNSLISYLESLNNNVMLNARVTCGGSEPPLALMKRAKKFGIEVIHAYGCTETDAATWFEMTYPELRKKLSEEEIWNLKTKQGLPIFGMEYKIIDENGNELPKDSKSVGEIIIRGHCVANSYYNNPATIDAFIEYELERWWKSGDAAYADSRNFIKIVDRFKDLIKSGGEWISSIDMENYLMAHPAIHEATVIGIQHEKWGERPLALVVLKNEYKDKVSKEEIYKHLSNRFAKWQLPDEIIFVNEIPKTSVGKFNKRILREMYKDYYLKRNQS